jgi:multiple sugar transport system permease protein
VLHDQTFWSAIRVTAKFVAIAVTAETLLGLLLALLVVREVPGTRFIRLSLILPMTVAPVVVGVIWRLMYASGTGLVNPMFAHLGLDAPDVLAHPGTAFYGLVLVDIWEWTPLLFLIILAGLQSLPQDPIEAAAIDGAGPLRTFFDHTLPLLSPVLFVGVILRLIDAIGTFDQIFVLTRGGPGTATQLISIYGYNTAFNFTQYGQAAAMLISLLAFVLLLISAAIGMMRRSARRTA